MGQLAADCADADKCGSKKNFQATVGAQVLPAIAATMEDASAPWRIRGHASSALINFCNQCPAKLIRPHVHRILLALFNLVREGPRRTKEEALTAVALVANVIEAEFGAYYDNFMPVALEIIEKATRYR